MRRVGGIINLQAGGIGYRTKGNFTWNLGRPKLEEVIGNDGVQGFKETPQAPYIEGEVTDDGTLDVNALLAMRDETVSLELPNGKVVSLRGACYAGEGQGNTEEGNIGVRFVGEGAEMVG